MGCAAESRTASPPAVFCYGYRVVKTLSGGTVTTGEREIEPTEAADRRAHLPRVHRRRLAEADREEPESRRCARSVRWPVESEHDLRQRQARNRHPEQRAVRRPPGLESASLREESGYRKARVAAQPDNRVDVDGKSRSCGSCSDDLWTAAKRARSTPGTR